MSGPPGATDEEDPGARRAGAPSGGPAQHELVPEEVTGVPATEQAIGDLFLANVTDAVVVYEEGGIILWGNTWGYEYLGYRPDEVVGRSITEFLHPDEIGAAYTVMQRSMDPAWVAASRVAPYRIRHRDGTYRELWLNGTYAPPTAARPGRWVLSLRRSSDTELFDELLELLTEGAPSSAMLPLVPRLGSPRDPGVEHAAFHADDRGAQVVTGSAPLAALGDPTDTETVVGHLARVDRFEGPVDQLPDGLADQARACGIAELASATVPDPLFGRPAVVVVAVPPTATPYVTVFTVRQMSRALGLILRARERAVRLDEAMREQRSFLADASHELRSPLTAILGFAELYQSGALGDQPKLDVAFDRIRREATRLLDLIEDLLLLARLGRRRPVEVATVSLAPLVAEAVIDARARTPDRAITIPGAVDEWLAVAGDEDRIRQVLANLLGNAQQHTPAGSPIEVDVTTTVDEVTISVTDHGEGLDAAELDAAFTRFWRGQGDTRGGEHREDDTPGGGSGLGLAIARSIAEAIGGRITVASAPGEGATFRLHLARRLEGLAGGGDAGR